MDKNVENPAWNGNVLAETDDAAFRRDLIEVLKKHKMNAMAAVGHLRLFCDDILGCFNTEDMREYEYPFDLQMWMEKRRKKVDEKRVSTDDLTSYIAGKKF